jgi:hypothetical protein
MKERIKKVLTAIQNLEEASQWDKNFLKSISEQVETKQLSSSQVHVLEKIEKKYDPATLREQAEWQRSYSADHREKAVKVAQYYLANPPYFHDIADLIVRNPDDHVLSFRQWNKMIENKYAKKVLKQYDEPPKFCEKQVVQLRKHRFVPRQLIDAHAFILKTNAAPIKSHAKGSRVYQILVIGDSKPIYIRECALKRAKKR